MSARKMHEIWKEQPFGSICDLGTRLSIRSSWSRLGVIQRSWRPMVDENANYTFAIAL
jgi:hypothetical protein